jgi:hypothetical protein
VILVPDAEFDYYVDGVQTQERVVVIEGDAEVTVTAVPKPGFVIADGADFTWTSTFDAKG